MKVPKRINGRKLTWEDKGRFIKNELTYSVVMHRLKNGCDWNDAFKRNEELYADVSRIVSGHELTKDMLERIESNGLKIGTVRNRLDIGWSLEDALSTPKMRVGRIAQGSYMSEEEAKEIVLRVRKLNATEYKDKPFCIPKIERIAGIKV